MFGTKKLLPADLLPLSLWDNQDGILNLPPILKNAYLTILERYSLDSMESTWKSKSGPVGGITKDETDLHLANSFDGSAARVQLAILDPNNEVISASESLVNILTGDKLLIVDAPCGAGAASLCLLTTVAELRDKNILPRTPLEVDFIGADISESARKYAEELVKEVIPHLEKQAIFLKYQFHSWDATSDKSTADLIKEIILLSRNNSRSLIVIANFSGFLKDYFKKVKQHVHELLKYSSGRSSTAIWIEPQTKAILGSGGLWSHIEKIFDTVGNFLLKIPNKKGEKIFTSSSKFRKPSNHEKIIPVRLSILLANSEQENGK